LIFIIDVRFYTHSLVVGFTTTCATVPITVHHPFKARCTPLQHYVTDTVCQWLATGRWFSLWYSSFLHQWNWLPWYYWNIVESGIKHHKPTNHRRMSYL